MQAAAAQQVSGGEGCAGCGSRDMCRGQLKGAVVRSWRDITRESDAAWGYRVRTGAVHGLVSWVAVTNAGQFQS